MSRGSIGHIRCFFFLRSLKTFEAQIDQNYFWHIFGPQFGVKNMPNHRSFVAKAPDALGKFLFILRKNLSPVP